MKERDAGLIPHFSKITDPRVKNKIDHKLIDIMIIAICAVICGADAWKDIEFFGKAKYEWFSKYKRGQVFISDKVRICSSKMKT